MIEKGKVKVAKLQIEQEILKQACESLQNTKEELDEAKREAERIREDMKKQAQ